MGVLGSQILGNQQFFSLDCSTDFQHTGNKVEQSKAVGIAIAKKAIEKGLSMVIFDRGGYLYHGRVQSLAEGAREGGLKF